MCVVDGDDDHYNDKDDGVEYGDGSQDIWYCA